MKKLLTVLTGLAMCLAVAACETEDEESMDSYRPVAYGENNQCYYLDETDSDGDQVPDEVETLRQDNLCQATWVPRYMPDYWLVMYAPYYHSPAYYDRYVAAPYRNRYVARSMAWEKIPSNMARVESSKARATWLSTKTNTRVPGTRIDYKTSAFGSGNLRSSGFTSGMRCVGAPEPGSKVDLGTPAIMNPILAQRSGGSSSRPSGGGYSGGSRSSGGSSSRSGSGSGSVNRSPTRSPAVPGGRPGSSFRPSCR